MCVGKLAYLATDPMTIQEGRRAITQAISDHQVKVRGPGCPHVNLPAQQPFWFDPLRKFPFKRMHLEMVVLTVNHHPVGPPEAKECNRHQRRPKASITLVPLAFPILWVPEQPEFIIDGFLDVV